MYLLLLDAATSSIGFIPSVDISHIIQCQSMHKELIEGIDETNELSARLSSIYVPSPVTVAPSATKSPLALVAMLSISINEDAGRK